MHVRCEHCGLGMEAPNGSEGKTLRCPRCERTLVCQLPVAEVIETLPVVPVDELVLSEEVSALEPEVVELVDDVDEQPAPDEQVESVDEALARAGQSKPKRIVEENPRQWHVMVGGVAAVALTFEELRRKAADGLIKPKTKIHYARKDLTVQARDIPGLFDDEGAERAEKEDKARPARSRRPIDSTDLEAEELAEALSTLGGGDEQDDAGAAETAEPASDADDAADALRKLGQALEEGDGDDADP